jgi:hypothetical protein
MVGEALVPYYRQILPMFNLFKDSNLNCGDAIDYGQQKRGNLGDLIEETLALTVSGRDGMDSLDRPRSISSVPAVDHAASKSERIQSPRRHWPSHPLIRLSR